MNEQLSNRSGFLSLAWVGYQAKGGIPLVFCSLGTSKLDHLITGYLTLLISLFIVFLEKIRFIGEHFEISAISFVV